MGLFMHRESGLARASELYPRPHAYQPPAVPPLSGEGACESCGREREDIVHALHKGPDKADTTAKLFWPDN